MYVLDYTNQYWFYSLLSWSILTSNNNNNRGRQNWMCKWFLCHKSSKDIRNNLMELTDLERCIGGKEFLTQMTQLNYSAIATEAITV